MTLRELNLCTYCHSDLSRPIICCVDGIIFNMPIFGPLPVIEDEIINSTRNFVSIFCCLGKTDDLYMRATDMLHQKITEMSDKREVFGKKFDKLP